MAENDAKRKAPNEVCLFCFSKRSMDFEHSVMKHANILQESTVPEKRVKTDIVSMILQLDTEPDQAKLVKFPFFGLQISVDKNMTVSPAVYTAIDIYTNILLG